MTKHTEGEWTAKLANLNIKDPMFYKSDVISGGIRVAQVAGAGEDCANANARLIAAAPELLEACKISLQYVSDIAPSGISKGIVINLLQQAIAKATNAEGN